MLLTFTDGIIEAGCDEAGRGCLAGPVVAGAVILPPDFDPSLVNDSKTPIAAASIMAKTHRDRLMVRLHKQYPHYGWKDNKGYGTAEHYAAINAVGITPLHRRSYRPIREASQLELEFS